MSVDMLLLDEQSTLITGSSTRAASDTFQKRLSEGSVYSLNGFDVGRNNPKFRLSDTPVSIRFNEGTFFEEKNTDEWFRFCSHKQLLTLANTNEELPDIFGELNQYVLAADPQTIKFCARPR